MIKHCKFNKISKVFEAVPWKEMRMGLRLHQTAKRRNGERVPTLLHAYCPFDVRVLDKAGFLKLRHFKHLWVEN